MLGGKNRQPLGYTIIEVMIVLAVSGVMFLIAATFINGKQARTAFTAGVNEMASQLQDLINQVQSGKYSDVPLYCQNGTPVTFGGGSPQGQGTNNQCVFLGKMIHFWPSPSATAHDYEILSIAASRTDTSGNPANTAAVAPLTTTGVIPQQLDVYIGGPGSAQGVNVDGTQAFTVGFLQSQGQVDSMTGSLLTGAQTIQLYYLPMSQQTAVGGLNSLIAGKSADICLTDGTRYAELKIGGQQSQLAVTVKMDGTTSC